MVEVRRANPAVGATDGRDWVREGIECPVPVASKDTNTAHAGSNPGHREVRPAIAVEITGCQPERRAGKDGIYGAGKSSVPVAEEDADRGEKRDTRGTRNSEVRFAVTVEVCGEE